MPKIKLPDELFVVREEAGNGESFLAVYENADEFAVVGETKTAGVYQLVRKVKITAEVRGV